MPLLRDLSDKVLPADVLAASQLQPFTNDFEQCLTYLSEDQPWLPEPDNLRNRAAFLAASRTLATTILGFEAAALAEPIPAWLAALVSNWHARQSRVITFNYDTLVEKAYTQAVPRVQLSYADHSELYAVPVPDIRSRTSSLWGRESRETFRYLKLHGSVNWCYSGAPSFYGETIYDLQIEPGWSVSSAEPADDLAKKAPEKVHLVVPPTTAKSTLFNNELVRSQWRLAQQYVDEAIHIHCLGYSLPETDQMVRYLLATCAPDKLVTPINTARVSRRYARLLPTHRVNTAYERRSKAIPAFVNDWIAGKVRLAEAVSKA